MTTKENMFSGQAACVRESEMVPFLPGILLGFNRATIVNFDQ